MFTMDLKQFKLCKCCWNLQMLCRLFLCFRFQKFFLTKCIESMNRLFRYENAIEVRPGDEIKTTCIYNSTTRDITTRAGMGYNDEMCFGFLTFYPKSAVTSGATLCTAWKTIPFCQFELGLLDDTYLHEHCIIKKMTFFKGIKNTRYLASPL